MLVDYLLLFISVFFIWRELFPTTDDFNPTVRKYIYQGISIVFLILSMINVYKSNKENNDLISTAKSTLKNTKMLNDSIGENLKVLRKSKDQIVEIDGQLIKISNSLELQVKKIDSTAGKTSKLYELQNKIFLAERPYIAVDNIIMEPNPNDTTLLSVVTTLKNSGKRFGKIKEVESFIVAAQERLREVHFFINNITRDNDQNINVEPNGNITYRFKPNNFKVITSNQYENATFYLKVNYADSFTQEYYSEMFFYNAKYIEHNDYSLQIPTKTHQREIDDLIRKYKSQKVKNNIFKYN